MSMFDIFRSAPDPAAAPATAAPLVPGQPIVDPAQQVPPNQGNIPGAPTVQAIPGDPNSPVVPAATPVAEPVTPDSPLAEFNNLWETPAVDPNNPAAPAPAQAITAEQIQKVVANVDFSNTITPENLTAIAAGGEEATKAFAASMNEVARQVMVQSTLVNNKLTEKAVETALKTHNESLPAQLRSLTASDHLKTTNPLFNNPAIKPVIEATQQQLLVKFPQATNAELTKMTQDYIIAMGAAFAPQATVNDNGVAGETDWGAFLEAPSQ